MSSVRLVICLSVASICISYWPGTASAQECGASLSWEPPTKNTDGTQLLDLAGFRAYWGCEAPAMYSSSAVLLNPTVTSYQITGLDTGTCYFTVTSFNDAGAESAPSNEASKTLGPECAKTAPGKPVIELDWYESPPDPEPVCPWLGTRLEWFCRFWSP